LYRFKYGRLVDLAGERLSVHVTVQSPVENAQKITESRLNSSILQLDLLPCVDMKEAAAPVEMLPTKVAETIAMALMPLSSAGAYAGLRQATNLADATPSPDDNYNRLSAAAVRILISHFNAGGGLGQRSDTRVCSIVTKKVCASATFYEARVTIIRVLTRILGYARLRKSNASLRRILFCPLVVVSNFSAVWFSRPFRKIFTVCTESGHVRRQTAGVLDSVYSATCMQGLKVGIINLLLLLCVLIML
jgi:hypothetical protein